VIDSASPYDVVTLPFQKDTPAGEFNTEASADENQEGCTFLTLHPLQSLIAAGMDTPLDLHSLAVTRIANVLEVPQQPAPVQCRILARVAHVHAVIHTERR